MHTYLFVCVSYVCFVRNLQTSWVRALFVLLFMCMCLYWSCIVLNVLIVFCMCVLGVCCSYAYVWCACFLCVDKCAFVLNCLSCVCMDVFVCCLVCMLF